jgi:DNA polymerase III delta prime subunit
MATLEKTLRTGGWLKPVMGSMKSHPAYLVLIDRTTFNDHQAEFINSLINQIVAEKVFITRYYFDAEQRRCYPKKNQLPPRTLTELAQHYPTHRLMIFSDGNGFINPITGELVQWIEQLSIWSHRVLFTLETPAQWGYREQILEEADFLILPANEAGLTALAENINSGTWQPYPAPSDSYAPAFPDYLNERPRRWLERHAPDAPMLTELLKQVRDFLGEDGYYWFSACAVYPEIRWQLTVYLGYQLEERNEEHFAKLARLPWFRYGYMPNWLRRRLVDDLSLEQEKAIRTALKTLLDKASEKSISDFQLEIADSPKSTFSALKQWLSSKWKRQAPKNSLRDYVFVTFMEDSLSVKAPKIVKKHISKIFSWQRVSNFVSGLFVKIQSTFSWQYLLKFTPTIKVPISNSARQLINLVKQNKQGVNHLEEVPEKVRDRIITSPNYVQTFTVEINNKQGEMIATGFVIAEGVIVTCGHVVQGIPAQINDKVVVTFSQFDLDYPTTVKVCNTEDDKDIAILIGSQSLPEQVKPAVLCSPNDVETPIEFLTVGYWKLGKRSGFPIGGKLLEFARETGEKPLLILETTLDNKGISGAPVYIPEINRVIGIITSYYSGTEKKRVFANPAEVIKEVWPDLEFKPPKQYVFGSIFTEQVEIRTYINKSQPPADPERRFLFILLEEVKRRWIDGVLKKSLHNEILHNLGKEIPTNAVNDRWNLKVERPNQPAEDLASDKQIVDVFDEGNRSLLILGTPGSGKTITLLELAKYLINRAESDPTQPIPVIFNLSSWKKGQSLTEWLIVKLYEQYGLNKNKSRAWLKEYWLLPLLDGLDEVKLEYQAACIDALNQFGDKHGLAGLVVCSRREEYIKLPNRLKVNGAISLQPLTLEKIDSYLEKAGSKLEALRTVIKNNTYFQEMAKMPVMLNVMSIVYQEVSIEELTSTQFETPDAHRKYLFDAFIARMFKVNRIFAHSLEEQNKTVPYEQDKTTKWLTWLAQKMGQHHQSDFLIEKMQPSWLSTSPQKRLYTILVWLSFGLFGALSVGLGTVMAVGWNNVALIIALIAGLFVGFFLAAGWKNLKGIDPVERLTWSSLKLKENLLQTEKMGRWFTMRRWVLLPLIWLNLTLLMENWVLGGIGALIVGLSAGLHHLEIEYKLSPNQGIKNSAQSAFMFGPFIGIPLTLFVGLVFGLELDNMLGIGLGAVLFLGFMFGGEAVIKHYLLRLMLYLNGYMPWKLVRFLNYATDRVFLQKRGGSYAFIHKLLQEHFAAMGKDKAEK